MAKEVQGMACVRSKKRNVILIISIIIAVVLIAFFLIGTFYGRQYSRRDIYIKNLDPLPPVTLYSIQNDIYVPVEIDESTHKISDNIPYYYGKLSEQAYNTIFDEKPSANLDSYIAPVNADFLSNQKRSPNLSVYRVRIGDSKSWLNDFGMAVNKDSGTEILIAKLDQFYSDNIQDNWYLFAAELDILFDVELRKTSKADYTNVATELKNSIYYIPSDDFTKGRFWHQFKKHLAFFVSDGKACSSKNVRKIGTIKNIEVPAA